MARSALPEQVREELDRILSSPAFAQAEGLRRFLRFVVEEALAGRAGDLKEYVIGTQALKRADSFDPRLDAIVRVEAGKLRKKLAAYYAAEGLANPLRIELPKGSYAPVFSAAVLKAAPREPTVDKIWLIAATLVPVIVVLLLVSHHGAAANRAATVMERIRHAARMFEDVVVHHQGYTPDPQAYDFYMRGLWSLRQGTPGYLEKSVASFQDAIAADPRFAPAYAQLATALLEQESIACRRPRDVMPQARRAAERAITLDSGLAEAHLALGRVQVTYDWKWEEGCAAIQRSIHLDPNNSHAHVIHAALCLARDGRIEEANAEVHQAQLLDPATHATSSIEISLALMERRYDAALERCRRIADISPDTYWLYPLMANAYAHKGMFVEAEEAIARAGQFPDAGAKALSVLAQIYAATGQRRRARALVDVLEQRSRTGYVLPTDVAVVYASLSDAHAAFAWLDKACQERCSTLSGLKSNVAYDNLRSDPRFSALLRRIGLL